VISVFHDLNLAAYYCDRLIMLKEKKVFAIGEPGDVLTRETINAVYGIDVLVRTHPLTGKPYILPVYGSTTKHHQGQNVHVICGGGTGSNLLYVLHREGFEVSAGVLNLLDTDYATATALGIPCITEAPFAAISPGAREDLEAVHRCRVCGRRHGHAHRAGEHREHQDTGELPRKTHHTLLRTTETRPSRTTPGGRPKRFIRRLLDRGAVTAERIEEVLQVLQTGGMILLSWTGPGEKGIPGCRNRAEIQALPPGYPVLWAVESLPPNGRRLVELIPRLPDG